MYTRARNISYRVLIKIHRGIVRARVKAKIKVTHFYRCYAPTSWTLQEFQRTLYDLGADARVKAVVVIVGDFNVWSLEWSSGSYHVRGHRLREPFAGLQVTLLNERHRDTPRKARAGGSLNENYANSDQQTIKATMTRVIDNPKPRARNRMIDSCFDEGVFNLVLNSKEATEETASQPVQSVN